MREGWILKGCLNDEYFQEHWQTYEGALSRRDYLTRKWFTGWTAIMRSPESRRYNG